MAQMAHWNTGHLALFEAIGDIADRIGSQDARDLANSIAAKPTHAFVGKMLALEQDSKIVEDLKLLMRNSTSSNEGFKETIAKTGLALDDPSVYRHRLRQLALKEQMLDTVDMSSEDANTLLTEYVKQYKGTEIPQLATKLFDMRMMAEMLRDFFKDEKEMEWTSESVRERLEGMRGRELMLEKVLAWPVEDLRSIVNVCRQKIGVKYPDKSAGCSDAPADGMDENPEVEAEERQSVTRASENKSSPRPPLDKANIEAMDEYRRKSNARLKKVVEANRTLQDKLRQIADNRNRWAKYAETVEKKLERSNALLKEHKLAVPAAQKDAAETSKPTERLSRPQTLERELEGDVLARAAAIDPSKGGPNLKERMLEMAASSQEEARVTAMAGRTAHPTQGSSVADALARNTSANKITGAVPARPPAGPENNTQEHPTEVKDDDTVESEAEEQSNNHAEFIAELAAFHSSRGTRFGPEPIVGPMSVNLKWLYNSVVAKGGYFKLGDIENGWQHVAKEFTFNPGELVMAAFGLKKAYYHQLLAFEIEQAKMKETARAEGAIAGTTFASASRQTDIQQDPISEPASPKLPPLLRTSTVQDSHASSTSVSEHQTSSTQAEHPTSGADTVDAAEANAANAAAAAKNMEDNDEPPVVVAEHVLRKRKAINSPQKKRVKIKQERLQSSPIALIGLRHLQTQESMDLDDIGPKTATPKKRRDRASAGNFVEDTYVPANDRVYKHAPTFVAATGSGKDDSAGDGALVASDTLADNPSPTGTPSLPPSATWVLKPRSANATILPRTSAKSRSGKRHRIEDAERGAELYSEDGENYTGPDRATGEADTPSRARLRKTATRLSNLLEKPSPRRWQVMNMDDEPDSDPHSAGSIESALQGDRPTSARKYTHERVVAQSLARAQDSNEQKANEPRRGTVRRPQTHKDRLAGHDSEDELLDLHALSRRRRKVADDQAILASHEDTAPPDLTTDKQFGTPAATAQTRNLGSKERAARGKLREDVPSTAGPDEEPLSVRPVSRLSLDDFRINPSYNNGLDYAYRDVVRGREKRKCLAGCTDPSCCGKGFRALAEIATPVREHATAAQMEEENRLLKDFLGKDAERLLEVMDKEERRETLIKAKTRELANRHGKHRHAYERRKSPPGFWRADFPTTQEEAEDRVKAKGFERELVQQRYEEAMRGGGKWIFRDQMGGQPEWISKN